MPSYNPSVLSSGYLTIVATIDPTESLTVNPSFEPTVRPSETPSGMPQIYPQMFQQVGQLIHQQHQYEVVIHQEFQAMNQQVILHMTQ